MRSGELGGVSGWNLAWSGDRRSPSLMRISGVVYRLLACAVRCRISLDRGFVCRTLSRGRDLLRRADVPEVPEVPEGWGEGDPPGLGSVAVQRRGGPGSGMNVAGGHSQRSLRVSDGGCDA